MKLVIRNLVAVFVATVFLAACGQKGSNVAVMDLGAILKASGQDEVIRVKAEAARNELQAQLQQVAANLDQQLAAEAEKVGDNPTAEQEQQLQQMNMNARNQLMQMQQQAQQQANQLELSLFEEFKNSIGTLTEQIAKDKGANVILAQDNYLFWFDPAADITDEVIAALRAQENSSDDEVAQVEEELEKVEGELAEVEEQLEELQDAVEAAEEDAEAEEDDEEDDEEEGEAPAAE
jgi:Skp family chaperone for outer membrane proteins